jgi:hypothetical protein
LQVNGAGMQSQAWRQTPDQIEDPADAVRNRYQDRF